MVDAAAAYGREDPHEAPCTGVASAGVAFVVAAVVDVVRTCIADHLLVLHCEAASAGMLAGVDYKSQMDLVDVVDGCVAAAAVIQDYCCVDFRERHPLELNP